MLKKLTPFLLALLPFFTLSASAQTDGDDDTDGDVDTEEPIERDTNAEFQVGTLFYSIINKEAFTVSVSPQYYDEEENSPGYDKDKTPKGKVIIPATIMHEGKKYTVTAIDDETFQYCKELTEVVLPETITEIGTSAFANTGISGIILPKKLSKLNFNVFASCKNLTEISIPESITSINANLFKGCSTLRKVTLPSTLLSIGTSAFGQCSALEEIVFPATLVSIDRHVFKDCDKLARVTCLFENPNQLRYSGIYGEIFEGTPKGMILLVPTGTKEAFAKVYPWNKRFQEIREFIPSSVNNLSTSTTQLEVQGQSLRLTLTAAQSLQVYTLQGQLQTQQQLSAGQHTISLSKGTYLVKVGQKVNKIAVQ